MIDWTEKKLAVWVLTPRGMTLANQVKQAFPRTDLFASQKLVPGKFYTGFSTLAKALATVWDHYDGHFFIMATGIVVRSIAPLIRDKTKDPAVVCGDETGRFVISLVSGHIGGANELAAKLSRILGATPVITTATDVNQVPAIDVIARDQGLYIENRQAIKHVNMALIKGEPLPVHDPFNLVSPYLPSSLMNDSALFTAEKSGIWVDYTVRELPENVLVLRPKMLVAGIGCRRGVTRQDLENHLHQVFQDRGFSVNSLFKIVSVDLKSDEPGLLELAQTLNVPIEFYTREELEQVKSVPNPSFLVNKHIGVKSVCEAAAMLATGRSHLLIPKTASQQATLALAQIPLSSWAQTYRSKQCMQRNSHDKNGHNLSDHFKNSRSNSPCPGGNTLYIVGTGPGHADHMSGRARQVLAACDIVVGYKTYLELIADVIRDKRTLTTGMTKEVDRVQAAIDAALDGRICALVSGGDAGIYAMAGLVLEMLAVKKIACNTGAKDSLSVEVVPGIPALAAGAALLGAPLTHDFATVSLSDLLTPWEMIEKRLDAAASADFVINIYNPKSKKRDWQLGRAMEIILKHRAGNTPVGIVTGAMRDNQKIALCALKDLEKADVGMQSIVIVGNSSTFIYNDLMITPRGYSKKYEI